jgi:hypothetical protein
MKKTIFGGVLILSAISAQTQTIGPLCPLSISALRISKPR